jgi:prophage regulatory protein
MQNTSNKIIRMRAVIERTGLSKSTIYTLLAQGDFPKRISLGARSMGFLESEFNDWVASRAARRA